MKVGIFDSGLGGLTVVRAILETIKGVDIHYIADTRHAPYGEKSQEEILRYALNITDYFIQTHHIDALVIACNSATTAAIATLRQRYPQLIIIGTEPGVKPAIAATKNGKVGILATAATLRSEKYQQLVDRLASPEKITLYEQPCPGLVEQIEQGDVKSEETRRMLDGWLGEMRASGVDTIVLGCTHYPLAAEVISELMEHKVSLIHTGEAIAKRLLDLAQKRGHRNRGEVSLSLYATGAIDEVSVSKIVGQRVSVQPVDPFG